jgi:hypothetical protein
LGTLAKAFREMAVIVGKIIIASTTEAVSRELP